jgi:hypothetical protein
MSSLTGDATNVVLRAMKVITHAHVSKVPFSFPPYVRPYQFSALTDTNFLFNP